MYSRSPTILIHLKTVAEILDKISISFCWWIRKKSHGHSPYSKVKRVVSASEPGNKVEKSETTGQRGRERKSIS